MKSFILISLTLLLVSNVRAQGFRDFRIPTNRSSALMLSAGMYLEAGENGIDSRGQESSYYNGTGTLYGYYHFDSENLAWQVVPYFSMWGYSSPSKYHSLYINNFSESEQQSTGSERDFRLDARSVYYPSPSPLGLEVGLSGWSSIKQRWRHSEEFRFDTSGISSSTFIGDSENSSTSRNVSVEFGVGWGRVRNASGIYSTYYLEQWLNELGLLNGELASDTKHKLANLAYLQTNYIREHQRAEKFYWSDVEKILSNDPAFSGPLNAYAVHRLAEASLGYGRRPIGFRIGLYSRVLHNFVSEDSKDEAFSSNTWDNITWYDTLRFERVNTRLFTDELIVGPRVQYFRPIGFKWQVNVESGIDRRVCCADAGFALNSFFSATYSIFDRFTLSYNMEHVRWLDANLSRDETRGSWWGVTNMFGASYFLEDQLQMSVTLRHTQYREESYTPDLMDYYDAVEFTRTMNATLYFTYRLGGNGSQTDGILPRQGIERIIYDYPSTYQERGAIDF